MYLVYCDIYKEIPAIQRGFFYGNDIFLCISPVVKVLINPLPFFQLLNIHFRILVRLQAF